MNDVMGKKSWELTPEKFLNEVELGQMVRKAEELFILGVTKKRKGLVRDSFLIHTALLTGLRNAEICSLRPEDYSIGNGESHLTVRNGKGGKQRVVHIGKDYKGLVKRFLKWKFDNGELKEGAYMLRTERAEQYCPSSLWRRWKKWCPAKTLHCARHTNATLLYKASGNNLRAVQKQLGHSRITTTQIYADVSTEAMRDSMSAMEKLANSFTRETRLGMSNVNSGVLSEAVLA